VVSLDYHPWLEDENAQWEYRSPPAGLPSLGREPGQCDRREGGPGGPLFNPPGLNPRR